MLGSGVLLSQFSTSSYLFFHTYWLSEYFNILIIFNYLMSLNLVKFKLQLIHIYSFDKIVLILIYNCVISTNIRNSFWKYLYYVFVSHHIHIIHIFTGACMYVIYFLLWILRNMVQLSQHHLLMSPSRFPWFCVWGLL